MGKKSAPKAPNYTKLANQQAEQQAEQNTQQTWANRANQTNPYGSLTWEATKTIDPTTGKPVTQWTQNQTLNPQLQAALDAQMGLGADRSQLAQQLFGGIGSQLGKGVDTSGFSNWGGAPTAAGGAFSFGGGRGIQGGLDYSGVQGVDNANATRQRAEDALYQGATSRLDPQWSQRQNQLETQLANRGITTGSTAYQQAMDDFNRQRTDAYSQAQNAAVTGAGSEAQRDYAMNMGLRQQQGQELLNSGNFANTAQQQGFNQALQGQGQSFNQQLAQGQYQNTLRNQQLQEALSQRGLGMSDINWLLNGNSVQAPQFAGYGQAGQNQTADLLGAANQQYGAQMDAYNARQAGTGNLLGAVGSIGGSILGGPIGGAIGGKLAGMIGG